MTERFSPFDEVYTGDTVAGALGSESQIAHDVAHGAGNRFVLGEGRAELEVFPNAGVARVTTSDARLELHRLSGLTTNDETGRVVFDQGAGDERTRLTVRGDGRLSFVPVLKAAESSTAREIARDAVETTSGQTVPSETTTATQVATPDGVATRAPETREETQLLRGRLGRDTWFTSDADRSMAGFPLAVNDETGGKTVWHRVVAFDETAEELHEAARTGQIRKGRMVDVMGQPAVRFEETARGGQRKIVEFHAEKVTRVSPSPIRQPKRG